MSRILFPLLVACLITNCIFAYRGHQGTQPEPSRQGTQPESSRQALAKRVFDRYVQALGGREVYTKITTRSLKGKLNTTEVYKLRPEVLKHNTRKAT